MTTLFNLKAMKILIFLSLFFTASTVFSQDFSILTQKSIGGTGDDSGRLLPDPQNNGEYFLISSSKSGISGDKTEPSNGGVDVWIVKLDNNFNVLWDKSYGGSGDDVFWSAFINNGFIYIATQTSSNQSGDKTMDLFSTEPYPSNIWILCLDLSGNLIWQQQFGGTNVETRPYLIPYTQTTFLMSCSSRSPVSGNKTTALKGLDDTWLVEVNYSDGSIAQQKSVGTDANDNVKSIKRVSNGNILLSITTGGDINGDKTVSSFGLDDIWLIEMDNSLNIVKQSGFGGNSVEDRGYIAEIEDAYYLTISTYSDASGNKSENSFGDTDVWLVKMDKDFTIIWDKTIGGNYTEYGGTVFKNANGKLVLFATSQSIPSGNKTSPRYGSSYDSWIVLLNEDGDLLEQYTLGGNGSDGCEIIEYPNDPTKLLFYGASDSPMGSGVKTSPVIGGSDIWLGVIDASNVLTTSNLTVGEFSVYPNPTKNSLFINSSSEVEYQAWISDLNGKQVSSIKKNTFIGEAVLDVKSINSGVYFLNISTKFGNQIKKIIIE